MVSYTGKWNSMIWPKSLVLMQTSQNKRNKTISGHFLSLYLIAIARNANVVQGI